MTGVEGDKDEAVELLWPLYNISLVKDTLPFGGIRLEPPLATWSQVYNCIPTSHANLNRDESKIFS